MSRRTLLSVLGLILASGPAQGTLPTSQEDAASEEAALIIEQLVESGLIKIEDSSGRIILKKSVLDILKNTGIATETPHSQIADTSCGGTGVGGGGNCGVISH